MANYTASDVKRLREETDAPMMECKAALDEADGDFDRAKQLLREKGKAAAGKRADRTTAAGVVAFAATADGKTVGGVVLESETDFVARNEDFIKIAQEIATIFRDQDPGANPLALSSNGKTVGEIVEEAVGKIRENIKVAKAVHLKSESPIATYVHHDLTKGAAILFTGDAEEPMRKLAIQVVAFPPQVLTKDQLSQEKLDSEIEVEKQRAMNEGKDEKMAENIARGRVNKEFVKAAVLMEQPYYADPSKSVSQYLGEEAKGSSVNEFVYLAVGQAN
jgi:elongation factor Ts